MVALFYTLKPTAKPLDSSIQALQTVVNGVDGYNAMKAFVKGDLKRETSDVWSVATDMSGGISGKDKGTRVRVLCVYASDFVCTHVSCAQWLHDNPYCRWNWDEQHKGSRISARLKNLVRFQAVMIMARNIRNHIMDSPTTLRMYQKYLNVVNVLFEKY